MRGKGRDMEEVKQREDRDDVNIVFTQGILKNKG